MPLLFSPAAWGATASGSTAASTPEQYMNQGMQAFQHGDFGQAVFNWQEAARQYEKAKQPKAQGVALTHLSQAYQALGHYRQAVASLQAVRVLAEQSADPRQVATALGNLGNVYIATGPAERAEQYLQQALHLAKELGDTALAASVLNNLGNLFTSQNKPADAFAAYKESGQSAQQAGQQALAVRARINAAMAAIHVGQYQDAEALLDASLEQIRSLDPSHNKAYELSKIGLAYEDLRPHLSQVNDTFLLRAADAFNAAASVAQTIGDPRATSYAWGYLGHLYEVEHRYQEALQLTRRAVAAAQHVQAPESLYRWQWQTGRLLKAQGHMDAALAAYRRAIATLQSIRQELSHSYGKPPASFRESTGRLYFEHVDLLLQQAASLPERRQYEPYLREARETIELFKTAELRDYFQDDCVDAAQVGTTPLDRFSQEAVIVYPILLPDRTELLVSLPEGLKRFTVPVGADRLQLVVRRFRLALQQVAVQRYIRHAQTLYDWLIRPLDSDLASVSIKTLVFVPDGALRTIPMAALHDGEQFLIRKYALATTPGLNLTDPKPLRRDNIQMLAVGLTEAVQGFAALPYVSDELATIHQLYGGTQLLNQDFLVSSMEKALKEGDFGIVHIASHGQFASEVEQSFILTFDDRLTLDRLEQFVGRLRFRADPLELLTLSACETAVGDDRAALGLAGIAVKAGARSALATLWRVQDEAAAVLVTEFYRHLQDPSVSRAVALQRAQLKLLDDPRYQSPFFWSPFLLINNWF
jgi:CHAT domain-containing protein